jgi:hypothetical protein
MKNKYLWPVEWHANGEYQVSGKLTDVQINAITDMIKSFNDKNGV